MAKYKETTVCAIFQNQVAKLGENSCVAYKKDGSYTDLSWNQMGEMVRNLASYLLSLGVKKGDRISIFSPNRYEWWVADQAILSIGAVNVPIYATNSTEEAHYVLDHSGAKICLVGEEEHLERTLQAKKKLKNLGEIIIFNDLPRKKKGVTLLSSALEEGAKKRDDKAIDKKINAIKPDDLATIMYTSGTTGNPKGVMLMHSNFTSNVKNIHKVIGDRIGADDTFLSFLPLSHSLERTAGYYLAMSLGSRVAFAEDISTLLVNFTEVRPSVIVSVPRIYEKVHAGVLAKVADASGVKKAIFNWAMGVARKNLPYVCNNKEPGGFLKKKVDLAHKLVWSGLRETLGLDNLRYAVSGGAPLAVSDAEFFIGMGMKILEGFGLTETTPVTNVNLPEWIKPGTIGPAIPETTLKVSDEGELLIKGPQVMKGYYKNTKATNEVMTKDGFFRSGDMARVDEDGFYSITGRIKDIIVTAGGKNISPQNIENSLKESKFIEQVAIIGDKRKYLSALIIPAFEALEKWAKQNGVEYNEIEDLIKKGEVLTLISEEIEKRTKQFARVEQIRKFTLLKAEWTQDTGELTPTQKVKRRIIDEKYAKEIESMYEEE